LVCKSRLINKMRENLTKLAMLSMIIHMAVSTRISSIL
jgi:hypothetical protein